eukprot:12891109-Prorocentrum_lima.AAC.1
MAANRGGVAPPVQACHQGDILLALAFHLAVVCVPGLRIQPAGPILLFPTVAAIARCRPLPGGP